MVWKDSLGTTVANTEDLQNRPSGLFIAYVKDKNGCQPKPFPVLLTSPDSFYIKKADLTPISCSSAKDGKLDLVLHGGTTPYRMLSNKTGNDTIRLAGSTYSFSNLDLTAGERIEVVFIDKNNIAISRRFEFKEPTLPTTLTINKSTFCVSDANPVVTLTGLRNGKFSATPAGLAIDEKTGAVDLKKSMPNEYKISYTTPNAICPTVSASLTVFGFPFKNLNNGNQIACEKLTLDAANSTMPNVTYKWSNDATTQRITVTKSGTYVVTINSGLCQILDTVKVQISNLVATSKVTHLRGNGSIANGEIDITQITGNIGNATISWADIPSVQRKRTGLKAGNYEFTVKDTLCSRTYKVEVKAPIVLKVTASKTDDTGCGGANGEIFLEIFGNGNETVTINGVVVKDARLGKLKAGLYKWTVKDTTGQEVKGDILLVSADSLSAKIKTFDASCTNDGRVVLDITGGRKPYSIEYTDVVTGSVKTATSNEISGLFVTANEYIFVITDATGCKVVARTRIRKSAISNLVIADSSTICEGNKAHFTVKYKGSLYPYSFSYSANREIFTVSGIMDSVFKVEVSPKITTLYRLTDLRYGANCLGTFAGQAFVTVNPLPILLNAQATNENCDNKDASILLSDKDVKAGKAPFLFAIQQVDSKDSLKFVKTMKFDSLAAGNYQVFVKEANGCVYQYPKTIEIKNIDCEIDFRKLPNTISPNGDGINDTFVIPNAQFYPEMTLEVQDRVGRVIYKGIYKDWNPNDTNETIGVYFYQIILGNGKTYQKFINVIR